MFGHTVGGAVGAVGKITGAMGNVVSLNHHFSPFVFAVAFIQKHKSIFFFSSRLSYFQLSGKGIAALTLDEDYQKKRRQQMAHNQRSIKEGGRGLLMVSYKFGITT